LSRSGGAGSRARRLTRPRLALTAVLLGAAVSACGGHSSSATPPTTPAPEATYGGLPSFLPSDPVDADTELVADASRPAVTSQGDSVEVRLATGSVHVLVTGPKVPGNGFPDPPEHTTCTWTVTLSGATAAVPLDVTQFTALDHLGNVYKLAVVKGDPTPPATVAPGATVTFDLRTVMVVGEGLMRWAPDTHKVLASWDFTVEND
jgi:hypothetical protein